MSGDTSFSNVVYDHFTPASFGNGGEAPLENQH